MNLYAKLVADCPLQKSNHAEKALSEIEKMTERCHCYIGFDLKSIIGSLDC